MERGDQTLHQLATDWRTLLFPDANDKQFADNYAQAVTFGLLVARAQGISLDKGIDPAAKKLASSKSLIGAALRILTDSIVQEHVLSTSISSMTRALAVVDWGKISKGNPDAWLYFYEDFLEVYNNELRKKTGSYYTPVEVVRSMTRLVNEALVDRFGLAGGFAEPGVKVVDPAVGTGTFLLEVIRAISRTIAEEQGVGAVPAAIADVLDRVIGFELQLGPYAVAQLRLLAELAELGVPAQHQKKLRLYVTNTLGNPFIEEQSLGTWYEPIAESRRAANKIKAVEPITVVLGNPPYKNKSRGKGGWIESGNPAATQEAPLAAFIPPKEWGVGAHVKHLYDPYIYFWRWATWKVFDQHPDDDRGVVCFITLSGFINGPGFQRMRDYLRRRADAIWVIECSPEGQLADVHTRIFQGVKQEICIMLVVRDGSTGSQTPAPVLYRQLAPGDRGEKFHELADIHLGDSGWRESPDDWRASFLPQSRTAWGTYPALDDLMIYSGSGIMTGRAWVIAPDHNTLIDRWNTLLNAAPSDKPLLFQEHKTSPRVDTKISDNLPGYSLKTRSISEESEPCPPPVRIAFRSFDRQWIIPDKRLINRPNPRLWSAHSDAQIYLTAITDDAPSSGPAVTFAADIPDLHHYHARGGRVYPLWLDSDATHSNIAPGLVSFMNDILGASVSPEDLFAYLAGVVASPAFTSTFRSDLSVPGIRVPITRNTSLFQKARDIGRQILWLHSFGRRYIDVNADRPKNPPRLPDEVAPKVITAIPSDDDEMPDSIRHDALRNELIVGSGIISNVTPEMYAYEVSSVNILGSWFHYRRKTQERTVMGDRRVSPLLKINARSWPYSQTKELLDLLNIIGLLVSLESQQADLLNRILQEPIVTQSDLMHAGILPIPEELKRQAKKGRLTSASQPDQLDLGF
ncbi:type ISP restriction/modification enzyme [Nonomuraea wenchangensis]|uniref:type ISP restriction/modification enzyme n=1 Tax=Nonomuraea wenchangensis TaxID=568860 RepID=UPI0033D193FF